MNLDFAPPSWPRHWPRCSPDSARPRRRHRRPPRPGTCRGPAKPEPDWTFTGNVGLYSQYVFRGISQTNEKPAVQGGFDLGHKSGFYAGTWASNISWISDGNPDVIRQPRMGLLRRLQVDAAAGLRRRPRRPVLLVPRQLSARLHEAEHDRAVRRAQLEDAAGEVQLQRQQHVRLPRFATARTTSRATSTGTSSTRSTTYIGKVTLIGHVGYQRSRTTATTATPTGRSACPPTLSGVTVGLFGTGTDADSALYTNRFGKDTADTQFVVYVQKTF